MSKIIFGSIFFALVMCRIVPKRENRHINIDFIKSNKLNKLNEMLKSLDKSKDHNGMQHTYNLHGSLHYRFNTEHGKVASPKVIAFEENFRKLLAMDGVRYIYKRGFYWRTWRKVSYSNGEDKIVFYKCNNPVALNSTDCQNVGLWNIDEESPPCPYELFTMVNDYKFCGAIYSQFFNSDINDTCPSTIELRDLKPTCSNPIVTNWQITVEHKRNPNKYDNLICGDRKFCIVTTTYTVTNKEVIFRIINSTNDIIYSRIMRPNSSNYICIENCGRYNTTETTIEKSRLTPFKISVFTKKTLESNKTLPSQAHLIPKRLVWTKSKNGVKIMKVGFRNSNVNSSVSESPMDHEKRLHEEYSKLFPPPSLTAMPEIRDDDTIYYDDYENYD